MISKAVANKMSLTSITFSLGSPISKHHILSTDDFAAYLKFASLQNEKQPTLLI